MRNSSSLRPAQTDKAALKTFESILATVVLELSLFEALMFFFTIATKYNGPLAVGNADSDDDRYDIVGC